MTASQINEGMTMRAYQYYGWYVSTCAQGMKVLFMLGVGLLMSVSSAVALETSATVLVDFDSVWQFNDREQDLGDTWLEFEFDDSGWADGPGLLGYDTRGREYRWPEPGLQTEMQPQLITYYLRTTFDYRGPLEGQVLLIEQILDDGAVYYLNGVEIARSALMPDGDIGFGTRATHWTDPWEDHEVLEVFDPPLRHGENVLAVSLHNAGPGSSDICLGVRMTMVPQDVEPIALYLTWQQDPTTTMTIQWQSIGSSEASVLLGDANGEQIGTHHPQQGRTIPSTDRWVYAAELTGLNPGTEYTFRLEGLDGSGSSPVYRFRTMPATLDRPLRIAMGGDVRHRQEWMEEMNLVAMRYDLDMIVWGGDLAYADGRPRLWYRWEEFFEAMMNTLIDDSGRLVPILFGIGNHEVQNYHWFWNVESEDSPNRFNDRFRERIAPFYFSMFAFPGHPGYGVLDFGEYMSIILLDTDHAHPMVGPQTDWFENVLQTRTHIPHVFPVYHVPAWPSHRSFDGRVETRVRELWVPLMERYGIQVAFENHDHTYKRTVPIREGRESPDGIVYIGDGCWGVREREVRAPEDEWYLAHTASMRHFILITVSPDHRDMKVIDRNGMLLDHIVQSVHPFGEDAR